jgi:hypothetical protein
MSSKARKQDRKSSFSHRLVDLISEPDFIRFENILNEPNFFRIVGRTHYERWHSCFLGWLLDPNGSHLLSTFTLTRFLLLLLDERCLKSSNHSSQRLLTLLPMIDFSDVDVAPNEHLSTETSIEGVGRFDIFLTAKFTDGSGKTGTLNLVVELKIDSRPIPGQSTRYADWLHQNHSQDVNLLVYLTPNLAETPDATTGDGRWYVLDYQLLNDKFLAAVLAHPNLNKKVEPFIIQYVKNLTTRYRGIKMATTDEEKKMAIALYEKYSEVFDLIYDALFASGTIDYSIADIPPSRGRTTGRLAIRIDEKIFSADTIRDLFGDVLRYVVDHKYILRIPLPWGSSNQRYIITNADPPTHPSGRDFFYPIKYEGYTIESHYARDRGLKVLNDLCDKLDLNFEVVET